jgi:hypothetical protein
MDDEKLELELKEIAAELEGNNLISPEALKKAEALVESIAVPVEKAEEKGEPDMRQILLNATIPQKIKYALFGPAVCRKLLILDPLKMIRQFVLRNPKMQLREVEEFCKNPNMTEDVLRAVAENKQWMGHYPLKVSVVLNPKTPPDVSLKWMRYLHIADIKKLSKSKNVSSIVAITARKRAAELEKK